MHLSISISYLVVFLLPSSLSLDSIVIYSYYFNLYLSLNNYYLSFIISFFLAIFFYKFNFGEQNKRVTIFDKILTVFLGYILLPIILSLPLYFSIYNLTFLNALFESFSGFTSTGFTIFENIKHIDQSLIIWRSSTQWIGGLYFLFSIVYLIDIYDESFKKSLTNFLSFNSSEVFKQVSKVFLIYTILTFFIFIILNLIGIRSFNSLNLSMSIISSGGFIPVNDLDIILVNDTQIILFSILILISFFSIFFIYNLFSIRKKNLNFFYEDLHLLFYFISVLIIFFLFFSFNNDFTYNLLSLTSSISNIGLSLDFDQSNLNFVYIILVIIGGSFFSTSSGLRFIKVYSLLKYSLNQILSYSRPKNIFMNKLIFSKINFEFEEINKYFLAVLIFILSLFLLTSLLSISGINFENSFKLSILTLMNTVNSSAYGLADLDFNNFHYFTKIFLIFFMIIGRIELISIMLIFRKFLFKN